LASVTIGNSVTSIGGYAFYGCTGLTSVVIGNSVTSIENFAFDGCTGLTSIVIPNSVTSIGWYAFKGCTSLTSITIPDSVTSIGISALDGCPKLTDIYCVAESQPSGWDSSWKGYYNSATIHWGYIVCAEHNWLDATCTTPKICSICGLPEGTPLMHNPVDSICTICGDIVASWTFENGVLTLSGAGAFRGNDSTSAGSEQAFPWYMYKDQIVEIVIGDNITSIGPRAFSTYSNLERITFGKGISVLEPDLFSYCDNLKEITFKSVITSIGQGVVYQTSNIGTINLVQSKKSFLAIAHQKNYNTSFDSKSIAWVIMQ
jgi:hypothetical protein